MNTMNTSYNPTTLDISSNVNALQDIPVVAFDNMSRVSTMSPIITQPTNGNDSQSFNIHAMIPSHTLSQPLQDCQISHLPSLAHPQETVIMSEYSFFYTPCNDFQLYYIICEEIPSSFEGLSQLVNNTENNSIDKPNNIYIFYLEQPEIKKIFQVTCEKVSHAFMFQFLNKIMYNIQFTQREYQHQEFSRRQQENLKFHLKKDLNHYLTPKNIYEDNYNLHKIFIQDYCAYENMINSTNNHFQQYNNANTFPFDHSYTFQQDNNYQLFDSQNGNN
ncbi:hypothetical protein C1645_800967 [Glomus cerebriforme]|uniref:Uncharacterized protein n=1 Tax=Glomus cerebriforme TaxID=658196 RepID=A0A397TVJ8_9GLOM|nr:hypothetical protein C1645_800967 [Glomus cerebriforme]